MVGAGGEIKLKFEAGLELRTRVEMEGVRFRGERVDMPDTSIASARGISSKICTDGHERLSSRAAQWRYTERGVRSTRWI